ncbi:MAG TPA: TonB-dependent receptor [Bacteroidia bacterium]|nr:TonB-dependent receptor [Bacteroidia bacterium]
MKYATIAVFSWLMLVAGFAKAQSTRQPATNFTITGRVTGGENQESLTGVSVYIPDLQRGVVSDENGNYKIDLLPQSIILIQYTFIGYKSVLKLVDLVGDTTLNIDMEIAINDLNEVMVTSNNTKLNGNIPFAVTTLKMSDLNRYCAPGLMHNLSYQPGIDKISNGNGSAKPVIRGLSFNRILLYSQGTRIENQQWDDRHDLGVSSIGLEGVETVRGPAALIYGANALGGALIFRDEKPAATGTTLADANLDLCSNTLGVKGDIGLKSSSEKGFFYGVRLGGNSQTSYVQGEIDEKDKPEGEKEAFAPNSKYFDAAAKAFAGITGKWGMSKLSYSYLKQQIGIIEDESAGTVDPGADEEEQRDREMEAPYQDVASQVLSLENTLPVKKSKINVNFAWQSNIRKEYEPLADKQKELAFGLDLNVVTYDVKWTSNPERPFGFTIGSQGMMLKNKNNGMESLVPDATESDYAGYGLFRYDKGIMNLSGGIRCDRRKIEYEAYETDEVEPVYVLQSTGDTLYKPEADGENTYNPVSFSIGACFLLTDGLTLKVNGASGFTAPNYAQLATFGRHEGTYRFERGNTGLKVEQNVEADMGINWERTSVTAYINGYLNKVNDYIYLSNTGDTLIRTKAGNTGYFPLYDYKQDDATLSGFEAGVVFHPAMINWAEARLSYALITAKLNSGGNVPYIPANKLVGEVTFKKEKLGSLNNSFVTLVVSNYSKQTKVADYELSSDGYTLLDLHIGTSFKMGSQQATCSLYCTNVLNTGYYNQLSLVKYIGVADMGRNIGVRVHIPVYFSGKNK